MVLASDPQHLKLRQVFVILSTLALATFFMIQAWSAVENTGPAARVQELTSAIDAELIDSALRPGQGQFRVEVGATSSTAPLSAVMKSSIKTPSGIIFLNFWATWCKPCVRELPSMLELQRTMANHDFTMIAVSYDEDWSAIDDFFRKVFGGSPRELVVARDPMASQAPDKTLKYAFGTDKLPETYVIKNGRVLARFINERNWMDPSIVEYFKRLAELP